MVPIFYATGEVARLISPTGKWDRQVLDYDGDWACFPF
jgi:hypothetical protein